VRLGTPALTTRGMGPAEMDEVGRLIVRILRSRDEAVAEKAHLEVRALTSRFPLFQA
jgi:glycine hydroxymethyltransferase